ncbi:hypothetical protein [Candidatus Vesicomyidisocius calyptogenae]|uniref:Uncharacterized protein n=1 Tax=Vesicomyosocius okutanii subsp. Calyptogena okutanii (strain HA) TaxID=412965 RepID=A5CX13_VESOH|nr:hypothetical protein [Candidatus Vesicomyosocius okutanii]BAF61499.1 hypothetical protein COSY_0377 [Candidatus Vesicomyosocius okutanii]
MENKSLFSSIALIITLIIGYFIHNNQVIQLNNKISNLKQEYNVKQIAKFPVTIRNSDTLENLNKQLIKTHSELKKAQDKLSLETSKGHVLNDEILQINNARIEIIDLKYLLTSIQKKLQTSDEKLKYLEGIFEEQNKNIITKNIAHIKKLKEASTSIVVTGLIVPAIGIATLISYTSEEIQNYCNNIKNTMNLEYKVFGKVISLNKNMRINYLQQCLRK